MFKLSVRLMLVLSACGIVAASDIRVDYNSTLGRALIWVEAEDYDSKTPEFVVDPQVMNASGDAFYFEQYSPNVQIDQWWAEYSIDSAAITEPAIMLSGDWYCWVRVNQPQAGAEEANYLLVKGDSGDGAGSDWYSTAIATVTDADDILNNDIAANGGAGSGAWVWMGASTKTAGVEKEFNLDTEGKIVFRINEREGGSNSARIDAICWTNDPNYAPNDAAFGKAAISDGLILELNAAYAGNKVLSNWQPLVSSDATGSGAMSSPAPVLKRMDAAQSDKYIWYYQFNGGNVTDIMPVSKLKFGADEEYTVEMWVRVPAMQTGSAGRGAVIGNADAADTGWRFGVRNYLDAGVNKFCMEFNIRDNETVVTAAKGIYNMVDNKYRAYDADKWYQLVGSRSKIELDTFTGSVGVKFSLWIDGVNVRMNTVKTDVNITAVEAFALDTPSLDAKIGPLATYPFQGDIALVRVYNRILSTAEVAANYNHGLARAVVQQCNVVGNDLNGDCVVDLLDFGSFASTWLNSGIVDGQ